MNSSEIFTIRDIKREDIPEVLKLEQMSFTDPWPEIIFLDIFRNQHAFLGVFESDKLLAFIIAFYAFDHMHLANLAVNSTARRRGIGKLLLQKVIDIAVQARINIIILEVRVSNLVAIDLYQKMGFTAVGSLPEYYEDKEDAVVFYWEKQNDSRILKSDS